MRRAAMPAAGFVLAMSATGCGLLVPPEPTEIPVGGERAPVLSGDLAVARDGMAGGLVEPSWLPDGFGLVFVFFGGALEQQADLRYEDGEHYVQIFQAHRGPAELGPKEPHDYGDRAPIGDAVEWSMTAVSVDPRGTSYNGTMPDGRTVSVVSNLDADAMERVLRSLYVRAADSD